jgi:surface protein
MSNWGKGVINNIGWGQGANNDIGWGSIYDKSNAGETLLKSDLNIDAFIIEVKTDNTGTSNDNQFQFTGAVGDYDVVAKQNDIVVATFNDLSGQQTITLPSSGVYDLEIKAKGINGFNRIAFNNGGDKLKITDIKQWGTIVWSSFERAFFGCSNMLTTATDVPNLSNVTSMFAMFTNATSANPDTTNWNVSNVTDMGSMFESATVANPDTTNWDVSSVTDMRNMFYKASSANPDTSNWDVSNVTDMGYMFYEATSANPDVSNWDVSNVTNMQRMFRDATSANPDTSNWDVSNVTNMRTMFFGASSANPDTSNWDVSNITNMRTMFYKASSANPDTTNWDVSNVTDMGGMFLDSNLSVENLTACYENWSQLNLQQNVSFSAGTTKYNSSGQAGRDILVNTYNWIIEDGGQV